MFKRHYILRYYVHTKNMKKLADKKLLIILLNIILLIGIIKICKVTGFCLTIINLISPLFFGYVIAWVLRPLIDKLKKINISPIFSTIIIYILSISFFIVLIIALVPRITHEIKILLPTVNNFINNNKYLLKLKDFFLNGD